MDIPRALLRVQRPLLCDLSLLDSLRAASLLSMGNAYLYPFVDPLWVPRRSLPGLLRRCLGLEERTGEEVGGDGGSDYALLLRLAFVLFKHS